MLMADEQSILDLFAQLLPPERWAELEGKKRSDEIFDLQLTAAMMMLQRLEARGTQQGVVQKLVNGELDGILADKGVRGLDLSSNTGGYARACGRLSKEKLEQMTDEVLAELRKRMKAKGKRERLVLVIDGTSISLEHVAELLEQFPPARNQYGDAHWGIIRMVAFHDLYSGIALRPYWGPMYGPHTVSEQELADQALEHAPAECVILGDGNFGIFNYAYKVDQSGRKLLFRLTASRANTKLMHARALLPRGERKQVWYPSRKDFEGNPDLPKDAAVRGRVIAVQVKGFRDPLYLFPTLEDDIATVVALYAKRWDMEVDLRALKRTLDLHHLRGKSVAAMEKELLIAVVAYGLVRAVMATAAARAGLPPRRMSFTAAYGLLDKAVSKLCSPNREVREQAFEVLLRHIVQSKLPNRSQPRNYPREVWGFRQSFPPRRPHEGQRL